MRLCLPLHRALDDALIFVLFHLLFVFEEIFRAELALVERAASCALVLRDFCLDSAFQGSICLLLRLRLGGRVACGRCATSEFDLGRFGASSRSLSVLRFVVRVLSLGLRASVPKRLPKVRGLPLKLVKSTVGPGRIANRYRTLAMALVVILHALGTTVESAWKMCLELLNVLV